MVSQSASAETSHQAKVSTATSGHAAWRACGVNTEQDHSGGPGIMEANEQAARSGSGLAEEGDALV